MKKTKVSLLALSVLVVGTLAASAATTTYRAYHLSVNYNNNVNARYWSVSGGPRNPSDAIYPRFVYESGSVSTDSSGKVSGVGQWTVTYSASGTPSSTFYGTVSGKLAGKIGSAATVTMTIKADGYTAYGTGFSTPCKGNFKFTGQAGPNPDNPNNPVMLGTLSGSVQGSTPVDPQGFKLPAGRVAYISSSRSHNAEINADVLQSSKGKMQLWSSSIQGNGSVNDSASYKATVKGVGFSKGISVSFSGIMGLRTDPGATNAGPFLAPITANILDGSKWNGQEIQGVASSITAGLIY